MRVRGAPGNAVAADREGELEGAARSGGVSGGSARPASAMTNFISVQLKKASEVDLAKPLCKFIQQSYSGAEAQAEHCRAAEELSRLRKSALGRPLDKHESSLETLLR